MESKSFLSGYKQSSSSSSSVPLFALFNLFVISFCRWVSSTRISLSRFIPLLQHHHQSSIDKNNNKDQQERMMIKQEDGDLCKEDAEMVMTSLGLFSNDDDDDDDDQLQERYSAKQVSCLFEEKEASLEEVKQAFDVFDENRDGFIDATELQRVLTILGFKEGFCLENCLVMIRSLDGNKDGRIDFNDFVKFMENSFY
ncbi:PREDICTED: probable calcium-binding protein CML30 [Camelina sativa]|uniref:Probable calcium-binding protein CML30 n=1 Tax=Camelina sativa TaxID=90675 RepID=A0ABM0TFK7_CAMSA|nr:PREDICTED: probable calcium-binding protein CML30 [Camelina sativa]